MVVIRALGCWAGIILISTFPGCGPAAVDTGPSYAELVVTYNAELETLDRLEGKREKLIQDHSLDSTLEAKDPVANLQGLLDAATELKDQHVEADPNALLDQLTDRSGKAHDIAGQLIDGLLDGKSTNPPEPSPEEAAATAQRKAAFDAELAKLDEEIAKQKARVERAREARDAAEAAANK